MTGSLSYAKSRNCSRPIGVVFHAFQNAKLFQSASAERGTLQLQSSDLLLGDELQIVNSLADRIFTEATEGLKGCCGLLFKFNCRSILEQMEAYLTILRGLVRILALANVMLDFTEPGELHIDKSKLPDFTHELEALPRGCFYGRNLGFQASSVHIFSSYSTKRFRNIAVML